MDGTRCSTACQLLKNYLVIVTVIVIIITITEPCDLEGSKGQIF